LPETANSKVLNDWLIAVRRKCLEMLPEGKIEIKPTSDSPQSHFMLDKAQSALAKSGINGTILYHGPSGSTLHGFFEEGGLEDSIGIYAVPTDEFLSLNPPPPKIIAGEGESPSHSDTYTQGMILLEISYALSLLAGGSHRLCELLWHKPPPNSFYSTNVWEGLVEACKSNLFTSHTLKNYFGIARGSLVTVSAEIEGKSIKKKPNRRTQTPERHLYHALRCLWSAEAVARREIPQIGNNTERTSLLWKLKKEDEVNVREIFEQAKIFFEKFEKTVEEISLPAFDNEKINKWLVALRKSL